jgi:hypothetical protein
MKSETREGPAADRTLGPATTTIQAASSITRDADSVDEILVVLGNYQVAAREIADSDLSMGEKCRALIELNRQARQEVLPAFGEAAVWGAARHLFESPKRVPPNIIEAIRWLRRRGHDACPTCRRGLPTHAELDRWQALGREAILRRRREDTRPTA